MLKWTGGSRRKVSTSRKSTQSKQKQYFEQKRRLQQTPGIENQSETDKWNHPSDARSLDILSFVNLAKVAQDKESVHTEHNNSRQTFNHPPKWSSPAALKKFTSVHPTKVNEEYDHNNSHVSREDNGDLSKLSPAMALKKIISELSNSNESGSIPRASSFHVPFAGAPFAGATLNSKEKMGDFGKMSPSIAFKSKSSDMKQKGESNMQSEVSLLDLLDDEHAVRKSMHKSGHEEYVAFSIKGLGKVEVETPPQSPVLYQRGCPEPPQRAARCTRNREFQSIPFGIEMVPDSILHDTNLVNDVRQSERMGDYGPFADNIVIDKENQFRGIYSPDSFDNFEGSPDCGQDNSFDEHIDDHIWKDTCEETGYALPGKMCDRSWDTNLFNLDNFYRTPNETIFDPGLTGFEGYNDFHTPRIGTNTKKRLEEHFAKPGPSSSSLTMENMYLPADSDWERDIPKFKRKSDFDGLFSPPVWPFKDGVADLRDTTSLISEESCSSTRVKKVKNCSYQSCAQKHEKNDHMDDFQMDSNMNLSSPKFNNVPCQVHEKSTRRTKSNTSGSKMQKASLSKDDMFLDCDLFTDCKMYTMSKEPSISVTIEQRSGTNLDFHANGEEKYDFISKPESEFPLEVKSSCVGEVGLGMKERCSENECESEEISDEAENVGHIEADKCSLEESPLVLEACANGIPNTPAHSRQSKRCNLAQNSCDKVSPLSSQVENQGDEKGKCDARHQVMLQSYVFQLLCVQKVLLEASGKDRNK